MMFRILFIFIFSSSLALANNLIEVDPADIENIEVGKRNFACARINNKIIIGKLVESSFIKNFKASIKKARKQVRKAPEDKLAKRARRLAKLKGINRKGKKACRQALNGGGDDEDSGNENNFDSNGDVTANGKALFQIPSNLSANVSRGQIIFQEYCTGCHMEQRNLTFPYYRNAIAGPPMSYNENDLPDQELADLVAWLNRFRFN